MLGDDLLKEFNSYLAARFDAATLRRTGWSDYLRYDRLPADDHTGVLYNAFCYLGIDEAGNWNGNTGIVAALVSFLQDETDSFLNRATIEEFLQMLKVKPVQPERLMGWFIRVVHWTPPHERDRTWRSS